MIRRNLPLTPLMMALVAGLPLLGAAEGGAPVPGVTVEAASALERGETAFREARFAEAAAALDEALRQEPGNARAQALRREVDAVLGQRSDRLEMAATWFRSLQDVRMQETVIRIRGLIESGDRRFAAGDYAGAELDYDRAEVGLRALPYRFDWGDLPARIAGRRSEARAASRARDQQRADQARQEAKARIQEQGDLQEKALAAKVDELLRRAKDSLSRGDYRRAEVDAWNAYELDRRREDARDLYLKARRDGHDAFDDRHEDERLERLARVNEEIYREMIPQSEILVYPEDWQRRSLRKPREIGGQKEEPWMAALRDRLDQRVSFEFAEQPFEDVVAFLHSVTGVNIIVAPSVTAKGGINITLRAKDMRFGDALKWVLELGGLKMAMKDQAIFISDQAITGAVALRMYDVADLVAAKRDFPGRELAFSSAGGGGGASTNLFAATTATTDTAPSTSPDELVEFIKKNVASQSWEGNTQVGIDQRAGSTLFISQTPEVHSQIEQVLANLRNQDSLQVKVDIRLLNVRKNYFEEIGFDWGSSNVNNPITTSAGTGYARQNPNGLVSGNVSTATALPSNSANYSQFSGNSYNGLVLQGVHSPGNFLSADQLSLMFSAVETESDLQQVSRPQITCFNGQQANASFVTQYAYVKGYQVVNNNLDPETEVLVFGSLIEVRPVVSSDRKYVMMEVKPSSVDLANSTKAVVRAPRIITSGGTNGTMIVSTPLDYELELINLEVKSLRSTIMLPDKGSLLLGGFQQSLRQRTSVGVPFLSHIPFLGRLFSRNGSYDDNRKLYYLLSAEILNLNEKENVQ